MPGEIIGTIDQAPQRKEDPLAEAFESDESFKNLLKNGTFDDYFNTFLSLPIFGKRLMYRKDAEVFEIEPPISRTTHYLLHDKVISWARTHRASLFLKTSICNEYRLCEVLSQLPVRLKDEHFTHEELTSFQKKYFSRVVDMQRMKRYFQHSIGGNLISFWLDAERYNRQIPLNCHRFVLKEITGKYLTNNAPNQLSEQLKQQINNHLRSTFFGKQNSCQEYRKLLIPMQELVIDSLREYWVPIFLQHRLERRSKALGRWRALNTGKQQKVTPNKEDHQKHATPRIFQLINKLKEKHTELEDTNNKRTSALAPSLSPSSSSDNEGKVQPKGNVQSLADDLEKDLMELELQTDRRSSNLEKTRRRKKPKKNRKDRGTRSIGIRDNTDERDTAAKIIEAVIGKDTNIQSIGTSLPSLSTLYADKRSESFHKTTLFEALHVEKETDYEADNEDDGSMECVASLNTEAADFHEDSRLPIITALRSTSKSLVAPFIHVRQSRMRLKSPFNECFLKENCLPLIQSDTDKHFQILTAALTVDPMAGNPLLDHFKETGDQVAESNLKFWNAANQILTDTTGHNETIKRMKQFRVLANLYLTDASEYMVTLEGNVKRELSELLLKDIGLTKLMEVCDVIAQKLMPAWEDFLRRDEETFFKSSTICKSADIVKEYGRGRLMFGFEDNNNEYDGTFGFERRKLDDLLDNDPVQDQFSGRRMWRAVDLAIGICRDGAFVHNVNEMEKWSTDEDEQHGSLNMRNLQSLNRKAQLKQEKLETLFKGAINMGLFHVYSGASGMLTNVLGENCFSDTKNKTPNNALKSRQSQARPPRPRCFHDVLHDSTQFDFFKRFLAHEHSETPLTFWAAIESMRTMSKSAKAKQVRAHGIVKRYFGPSTNYGKALSCDANVMKEILQMEKVPLAMLLSAQTCVAKSMEESWFTKYLETFQDEGGVMGITILPVYGNIKSVKQKTRGLWQTFTRNVVSFRRGILSSESLKMFQDFLLLQHQLNVAQQGTDRDHHKDGLQSNRIMINNKLIYTDKLNADLKFWSEVEKYKDFADAVVLCAKLGNYTTDDELIVIKKAKTIVDCFIDSQITPRIQINVTNDVAENIIHLVHNGIIERGLFHDAALSTFATLIHFWKKFCLHRFLPKEKLPPKPNVLKSDRSAQIHIKEEAIQSNQIKKINLSQDEECPKILFSLQFGIRMALHRQQYKKKKVDIQLSPSSSLCDISPPVLKKETSQYK